MINTGSLIIMLSLKALKKIITWQIIKIMKLILKSYKIK